MRISENIRELQPSATLAVTALARQLAAEGRDVVDLSAGEPDLPTPEFISEAAIAAIRKGATRYTPAAGILALRKAIATDMARRSGRAVDPAGIVVTAGAKQALFNICFTLFGPGDRVLVPAPYWTSYPDHIRLARAEPVIVEGDPTRGGKVDVGLLESAYDPAVRGLILNSPSNPTGVVYRLEELEGIMAWAAEREVRVISDEIYGRLCYIADHAPGLLDLDPAHMDRAILVDGASKAFAMTGWRIGYSYCDPALADRMAALQSHMTSNAATPSQYAALAAYGDPQAEDAAIAELRATFRRRRDLVVDLFAHHLPEVTYYPPDGAFYLFFQGDRFYSDEVPDSVAFCRWLLQGAGVALVPGAAFGDDRSARLSFATSDAALEEGVRRIARAVGA